MVRLAKTLVIPGRTPSFERSEGSVIPSLFKHLKLKVMPGYCGLCNSHYTESFEDHEFDCPGEEMPLYDVNDREAAFQHEKKQQGWGDEHDEEIWNKHFRF